MKLSLRKENKFILHYGSVSLFKYFNYRNTQDYKYKNVLRLIDEIDNFDKKAKIWKELCLNEKLIAIKIQELSYYDYSVKFFNKQELKDLIDDLLEISEIENKKLFKLLTKIKNKK